jgi:disulfide bond formation protein DsbB
MMKSRDQYLWFAWFVALVATCGSLYFSEIKHWTPCILCWYQRIFMYPLVLILFVGALGRDRNVIKYALPMAIVGWFIALYHNLLRWGIIPETCPATGPSCLLGKPWFGFITIPLLSLTAFTLIIITLYLLKRKESK